MRLKCNYIQRFCRNQNDAFKLDGKRRRGEERRGEERQGKARRHRIYRLTIVPHWFGIVRNECLVFALFLSSIRFSIEDSSHHYLFALFLVFDCVFVFHFVRLILIEVKESVETAAIDRKVDIIFVCSTLETTKSHSILNLIHKNTSVEHDLYFTCFKRSYKKGTVKSDGVNRLNKT